MELIGQAITRISGLTELQRKSAREVPAVRIDAGNLPEAYVREIDHEIPRRLWCGFSVAGKPREIRRPLTPDERRVLTLRAAALEPVLAPYVPEEIDDVVVALADMLGGFAGARQSGAEAVGKIDSLRRLLAPFPAWAIRLACQRLRSEGYDVPTGDGGIRRERHWPPADAELVDAVRRTVQTRSNALESARMLLTATVTER